MLRGERKGCGLRSHFLKVTRMKMDRIKEEGRREEIKELKKMMRCIGAF